MFFLNCFKELIGHMYKKHPVVSKVKSVNLLSRILARFPSMGGQGGYGSTLGPWVQDWFVLCTLLTFQHRHLCKNHKFIMNCQ